MRSTITDPIQYIMDEIKNTTEVEEVKATAECVNPEASDVNAEAVVAANETAEAEPEQPKKAEPASKPTSLSGSSKSFMRDPKRPSDRSSTA